ncbi:putative serine-rich protein [Erysiphe neolycopersici]|uniref:Putative serine-rich protein n=1 Tax=Erysiphe neolycopersici TaxID=212602 RepID=A0A420HCR0_9PEZI|nr:putative serine-rich protein [Erysiphe neolycopersici]
MLSPNDSIPNRRSQLNRTPLLQRSESETNSNIRPAIRLVPKTPPKLLGSNDKDNAYYYSRTPLPTHPSQFLIPRKVVAGISASHTQISEFQNPSKSGNKSSSLTVEPTPIKSVQNLTNSQPLNRTVLVYTGSPTPKPSVKKRQLRIHEDSKTFSLCIPSNDGCFESETGASRRQDVMSTNPKSTHPSDILSSQASPLGPGIKKKQSEQGSITNTLIETSSTQPMRIENNFTTIPLSDKSKRKSSIDSINSSPYNYEFIGGLRKVAETPDHKHQSSTSSGHLSSLFQLSDEVSSLTLPYDLLPKSSFSSTNSTSSETTNYKIYGEASVSESTSSIVTLSPLPATNEFTISEDTKHSLDSDRASPATGNYNESHEVFRGSSQSNLSLDDQNTHPRSLIVSPIKQKVKKVRIYHTGVSPSKSRKSHQSELSSFSLNPREAFRGFFSSNPSIQFPFHAFNLSQRQIVSSSWAETLSLYPPRSHMNEYPHQWSSQLSTVLSVSEGSEQDARSWSEDSRDSRDSIDSRGGNISARTSQDLISPVSRSMSWNDSTIERPPSAFKNLRRNSTSPIRTVIEQDEHGDGITDMYNMRVRPIRRRTSGYLSSASSDNGRTNTMRSSISTHSMNLTLALLPAWAKLYYGGGEKRFLHTSRGSIGGIESRTNSFGHISSSPDQITNLPSSHKRPTDNNNRRKSSIAVDTNIMNSPDVIQRQRQSNMPLATWNVANLWSPHLRPDKRSKRNCIWGPPSVNFGADAGLFGRRNIQVVMFILGFIFPFSWMIASVLPLPHLPVTEMSDEDRLSPTFDIFKNERATNAIDEVRYESAAWWRKLNRYMSILGVLIIAAVVRNTGNYRIGARLGNGTRLKN